MTADEIDAMLAEIFSGVFGRTIDIRAPMLRENVKDWDSLKHMEVIFAVEAATGLLFGEEEIASIKSMDDLRRSIGAAHAT